MDTNCERDKFIVDCARDSSKNSHFGKSLFIVLVAMLLTLTACENTQEDKDRAVVQAQQEQYAHRQPIPVYDYSLERHLVTQLYNIRNKKVATHAVWRSDYGLVEGDCPSMGFGIPFDTSLTNPLQGSYYRNGGTVVVEQAEPNGIFASKNTAATWVMCVGETGSIEPHYVESKVSIYPYAVEVDYDKNRVTRVGKTSVTIQKAAQ
jgi:hypothetical protein